MTKPPIATEKVPKTIFDRLDEADVFNLPKDIRRLLDTHPSTVGNSNAGTAFGGRQLTVAFTTSEPEYHILKDMLIYEVGKYRYKFEGDHVPVEHGDGTRLYYLYFKRDGLSEVLK